MVILRKVKSITALFPLFPFSDEVLNNYYIDPNTLKNITEIDVLGYHKMGEIKWKKLGIKNEFENLIAPTEEEVNEVKKFLNSRQ